MDYETIIKIVSTLASFLFVTLIPIIVMYVKKFKAWKEAKIAAENATTEAEKQAAEAAKKEAITEMLSYANTLVVAAEETYKNVDTILKNQGQKGCGAVKKDSVMTKLQAACMEKGVEFNEEFWSGKIDELVQLTRKVNAK